MSGFLASIMKAKEDLAAIREDVVTRNLADTPTEAFQAALDELFLAIEDAALKGSPQECNQIASVVNGAIMVARYRRDRLNEFELDLDQPAPRFGGEFWTRLDCLFSAIDATKFDPRPPAYDSPLTMHRQGAGINQIHNVWQSKLSRVEIIELTATGDASKDIPGTDHPDVAAWQAAQAKRPRLLLHPLIAEAAMIRFQRQAQSADAS